VGEFARLPLFELEWKGDLSRRRGALLRDDAWSRGGERTVSAGVVADVEVCVDSFFGGFRGGGGERREKWLAFLW